MISPGVTFATTGVAPDLVEDCLRRPRSLGEGDAGLPFSEDLTWTFHVGPFGNFAFKSAEPLLPGLKVTFAPFPLNERATLSSCSLPFSYGDLTISLPQTRCVRFTQSNAMGSEITLQWRPVSCWGIKIKSVLPTNRVKSAVDEGERI